jgi:hypothetical protein
MKKTIEMPEVMKCEAGDCSYNHDATCHARAITVGDQQAHLCDTMWMAPQHAKRQDGAGVGACRSANCAFNEDLECQADGVNIVLSGGQALCGTFAAK